jgi:arylsulfatase A-like enzyme
MDDEIGKVLAALDDRKMRGNTLIVFHNDNSGTRDAMFAGEGKVKTIPCDNGPLKGGKGSLYEGGTRVSAFANWPGKLKPGISTGLIDVTDMLPTLAQLADGPVEKCQLLDGRDAWTALTEGKPTGRTEVVNNIEPFNAAVREGDWKLVWKTVLPSRVELYNIAGDPNEKNNLADQHPGKVRELQARIEQLAARSAKPLFMQASVQAILGGLFGPAPIPTEDNAATHAP